MMPRVFTQPAGGDFFSEFARARKAKANRQAMEEIQGLLASAPAMEPMGGDGDPMEPTEAQGPDEGGGVGGNNPLADVRPRHKRSGDMPPEVATQIEARISQMSDPGMQTRALQLYQQGREQMHWGAAVQNYGGIVQRAMQRGASEGWLDEPDIELYQAHLQEAVPSPQAAKLLSEHAEDLHRLEGRWRHYRDLRAKADQIVNNPEAPFPPQYLDDAYHVLAKWDSMWDQIDPGDPFDQVFKLAQRPERDREKMEEIVRRARAGEVRTPEELAALFEEFGLTGDPAATTGWGDLPGWKQAHDVMGLSGGGTNEVGVEGDGVEYAKALAENFVGMGQGGGGRRAAAAGESGAPPPQEPPPDEGGVIETEGEDPNAKPLRLAVPEDGTRPKELPAKEVLGAAEKAIELGSDVTVDDLRRLLREAGLTPNKRNMRLLLEAVRSIQGEGAGV